MNEKLKRNIQQCKEQVPVYIDSLSESLSEVFLYASEFFEAFLELF